MRGDAKRRIGVDRERGQVGDGAGRLYADMFGVDPRCASVVLFQNLMILIVDGSRGG